MGLKKESKNYLEDFKTYLLIEKNFSKHTAKAYYSDVMSYLLWLDEESCLEVNFQNLLNLETALQKYMVITARDFSLLENNDTKLDVL